MVNLTTFMVVATAMLLGVQALDKETAEKIKKELIDAKIIPDAVEEFEPLTRLKIAYNEQFELQNGENIKPEQTLVAPNVWFDPPNKDAEYTLAMVNLDSNNPLIRHWISTNIKVNENNKGLAFLDRSPRHQYTAYKGPTPPAGSEKDRVAFVLFEQKVKDHTFIPEIDNASLRNRAFFDLNKFAKDNQLKPVGAAFYHTEYQEGFSQTYPSQISHGRFKRLESGKINRMDAGKIKQNGYLGDAFEDIGNLPGLIIGHGHDDEEDSVPVPGPVEDLVSAQVQPLNDPASASVFSAAASPSAFKEESLLGDLLNSLGQILQININIGGHYDDNDKDNDGEGLIDINIGLASASASLSAPMASHSAELKQAALIGGLLDGIGLNIARERGGGRYGRGGVSGLLDDLLGGQSRGGGRNHRAQAQESSVSASMAAAPQSSHQ